MALTITDNTKDIMTSLTDGSAFDTSMLTDMSSLNGQFDSLAAEQSTLFGSFSSLPTDAFSGLEDSTPFTADDLSAIPGLDADTQTALVGKPKGLLTSLQAQATSQFSAITDNLSLYATHQSVQNALGTSSGCSSLTDHFGSIMAMGQGIAAAVKGAKGAIDELKQYKTQIQSEIDSFDQNAIGILTGKINGTVLSGLVKGSGLSDQIDKILVAGGANPSDVQGIKDEIATHLTPNLNDFYNKKSAANAQVQKIADAKGGILGQIGKELTVVDKATTTLRKLGAANSLQGLFKANECAQTLLGFVASSDFLGKLGQG